MPKGIERYLDEEGRLKQWPGKYTLKMLAYAYLADKFLYDKNYTEKEVNAILEKWHTFGDYFLLRRGLIETGYLKRVPDGSKYWKNKEKQEEN